MEKLIGKKEEGKGLVNYREYVGNVDSEGRW